VIPSVIPSMSRSVKGFDDLTGDWALVSGLDKCRDGKGPELEAVVWIDSAMA
jgi:hypothetical protein